ncbi:bleomycin resistance protein [Martelella endophytica]|uniref:Bleomycin resistance protein n=1 Tax=Martelella endophytica TaxID=1486262 RepID=A0A0D5LUE4_MAREN|nr:VOC family protein [Martelella endophytica]AJY47600.1 glyoxalase [Martelella endophytica]
MRFNALIPELGVTDLAKSLDFYVGLIGFSVAYDRPEEGFAFLELGEAQLMLDTIGMGRTIGEDEPILGGGINFQLEVADLASIVARLKAAGWPLVLGPEERRYRTSEGEKAQRQLWVRDPDGYLLRPFQPVD